MIDPTSLAFGYGALLATLTSLLALLLAERAHRRDRAARMIARRLRLPEEDPR